VNSVAVHRLRLVSAPEAVSFLVLLVCSVLKRTNVFDAVGPMGLVHGLLFLLYVLLLADAWRKQNWDIRRGALLFVLSVLPTGGFFAERMLAREERNGPVPTVAAAEKAAA
jgi:integral membrane protein